MYQNKRINILHIPIDILNEDQIDQAVKDLLNENNPSQICYVSYRDIIKAQFSREYMEFLRSSRLNIPITSAVTFGAKYLKRDLPIIYNPFTFIIRLLGALELNGKSIYILGSRKKNIMKSESNLRASFPGLQIVGRYAGTFSHTEEKDIILAVKKSSPSLLLTGKGLKGNNLWIFRNKNQFPAGIELWGRTCFEVFSGKKKKPLNITSATIFWKTILSIIFPWRLLTHFTFFLLLSIEKIKNR